MKLVSLILLLIPLGSFSARELYSAKLTFLNGQELRCLAETPSSNKDSEIGYQLDDKASYQVVSSDSLLAIEVLISAVADPVVFEFRTFGFVKGNRLKLKDQKQWLQIFSEWKSVVVYASSLNYLGGGVTNGVVYYARKKRSSDVYMLGNASSGATNLNYFTECMNVFMPDAPELLEKIRKRELLPHQMTEIMDLYQRFLEHGKLDF